MKCMCICVYVDSLGTLFSTKPDVAVVNFLWAVDCAVNRRVMHACALLLLLLNLHNSPTHAHLYHAAKAHTCAIVVMVCHINVSFIASYLVQCPTHVPTRHALCLPFSQRSQCSPQPALPKPPKALIPHSLYNHRPAIKPPVALSFPSLCPLECT